LSRVDLPVTLEIVRKIEHRLVEHPALAQKECNQKAPNPPVPIKERVDCLELRVGKTDLDQKRQAAGAVKKFFEVAERLRHNIRRRRNEDGFVQRAAAGANPVLGVA
jgi:hypothetical protein